MQNRTTLEKYGSYENSITESKIIKGHNNVKYVVGGNARYKTRSNIIDWDLVDKSNNKSKIKVINDIMQFPEYIDDSEILCTILNIILKLNDMDFAKLMEKSLNLNESIQVQLRRLFYIIDNINKQAANKYESPTTYCPYEPIKRINILLNVNIKEIPALSLKYSTISNITDNIKNILIKKHKLQNIKNATNINQDNQKNITNIMDAFMARYTNIYDTLHQIENTNIEVSQEIEQILDLLEN